MHVRDWMESGGVRSVRCAGREIVRRIFVSVRDRHWQEIPPSVWTCDVDEAAGRATLSARHTSAEVDFEWRGNFEVRRDGQELRFGFEGRTLRDMDICRLGLVVLHPPVTMIGSTVRATGPSGTQRIKIQSQIHPQPVEGGIPLAMTEPYSELTVDHPQIGTLRFCFEGDLFELEDQRNWGDASFKTYCTPLRLGFPRTLKAGQQLQNAVEIEFKPAPAGHREALPRANGVRPITTCIGRIPLIGAQLSGINHVQSPVSGAGWRHVQVDARAIDSPLKLPEALDGRARIELCVAGDSDGQSDSGFAVLRQLRGRHPVRVLLQGANARMPSVAAIRRWRERLDAVLASGVPLLAATRGYFVEFNRGIRPTGPLSGIAFPLTATVHSDDAFTVVENVGVVRDMAKTARHFGHLPDIALAPLALYHPASVPPRNFPPALVAPWLLATIAESAAALVSSVTLANDVLAALATLMNGRAVPFLGTLVAAGGQPLVPLSLDLAPNVHAMALRGEGHATQLLLANISGESSEIGFGPAGLRAQSVIDGVTGAELHAGPVRSERIHLPPTSVAFATLIA
jgi:hypothetical protein